MAGTSIVNFVPSGLPEGERYQDDNLSGRHLGVVQEQGDLDRSAELGTGLIIQCLGLTINLKKSQLEPTQDIVLLGLQISTLTMQNHCP